jgi:hypothetical protein
MSARRIVRRLRLWWAERALDRPFSVTASARIDAALSRWEGAR